MIFRGTLNPYSTTSVALGDIVISKTLSLSLSESLSLSLSYTLTGVYACIRLYARAFRRMIVCMCLRKRVFRSVNVVSVCSRAGAVCMFGLSPALFKKKFFIYYFSHIYKHRQSKHDLL